MPPEGKQKCAFAVRYSAMFWCHRSQHHRGRDDFKLNQTLIVHRLGTIGACDSVLLAIVSGKTRDRCFAACSWIVDEVKKEEFIEQP